MIFASKAYYRAREHGTEESRRFGAKHTSGVGLASEPTPKRNISY
jgi:hypothetical protein